MFQSKELKIDIYWNDVRSMCACAFLRLDDYIDNTHNGMVIPLEPQGTLFAEVSLFHRLHIATIVKMNETKLV